jgi:L-threonylcarbamoyladenylate synthase
MTAPIVPLSPETLQDAANLLRAGALVITPTDTVYGMVADATNDEAIERLYRAKGREPQKPFLVLVPSAQEAKRNGIFGPHAARLAEQLWPGPLSLIVPRAPGSLLSPALNRRAPTIALRVPDCAPLQALLAALGRPLAAPSANRSGQPPAQTAAAAAAELGTEVALILDGGPSGQTESTLLDLTDDNRPRLLRAGPIGRATLVELAGPLAW